MSIHASKAVGGYGVLVEYGATIDDPTYDTPSEVWTEVHEVISAEAPNVQTDEIEVSHSQSPNRTKEYIAGWNDAGHAAVEVNWNPRQYADHANMITDQEGAIKRHWRITLPEQEGAPIEIIIFPGFVKGIARTPDIKGAVKAKIDLRCSAVSSTVDPIS